MLDQFRKNSRYFIEDTQLQISYQTSQIRYKAYYQVYKMKDKFENKHDRHSNQAVDKKLQKSYADHGHLMKSLNICSKAFQKISRSYFQIKSNILVVSEALHKNYFTGISHTATKGILEYICQANGQIADYCKQYANQLNNLHVMYAQLVKQRYGEYREQQQNYQHYLSKVESLSKSPQIDRFERNKDKLKNAYSSYQSKSNELMQLLTATNQQTQKIWQKKIINFSTAFVRSYANVLKNTQKLIKDHEDDSIIIDEEDHDPQLVLKNTNSQKNVQDLHHRVEKMLNQAEDPISQTLVASYFKQNSHSNNAATKDIQKIFGPSRYKLSPQPQQATQQKLVKSCEVNKQKQGQKVEQRGKADKFQSKNDFSIFENVMSQKKETIMKSSSTSPVVIQIPSARPGAIQKVKKNNQVNLLDL